MSILEASVLCLSFLLGSIPFGILIGRLRGVDIRSEGSGNIGATNAIRSMGVGPGLIVCFLDALKGAIPVVLAKMYLDNATLFVYVGLLAILGHIFSPWVKFKGGKGAATGLGVLFGMDYMLASGTLFVFVLTFFVSGKRVSVGSMVAATLQALIVWFLPDPPLAEKILCTFIALFIVIRHKDNIRRLLGGKEAPLKLP